jgi:hypothetical protein
LTSIKRFLETSHITYRSIYDGRISVTNVPFENTDIH